MNYDAAVQTVKPRASRPGFRKRRFNTSWCNPVVGRGQRSQRPAQSTYASSSKHARNSAPSSSPPPPVNTNTVMPRRANLSDPNPFYNDIAPLYAKFLNSTDVKRVLKQ
ncbi:hypothetical protein GN244_ATG10334 [Phytophthora infestans]|uniref:Uncharacterized protein n=1 Tax=Phytophthora infestans TaxID=4787 RepID=A0A833T4X8_PHYIN|nr:hypothetical protein GN244_ATG10334 [Phytophthora infestans]KAF4140868.1 hypothetical protein GN958_ATG09716 [Phytophthora infestans]